MVRPPPALVDVEDGPQGGRHQQDHRGRGPWLLEAGLGVARTTISSVTPAVTAISTAWSGPEPQRQPLGQEVDLPLAEVLEQLGQDQHQDEAGHPQEQAHAEVAGAEPGQADARPASRLRASR